MTLNVERFLVESYPPPPAPSPNLGSGGIYQNACIFTISVCLHGLQARHRKICKYCPLSQKNSGPFPWAWGKIWFYCERYSNVTTTANVNYCKKKKSDDQRYMVSIHLQEKTYVFSGPVPWIPQLIVPKAHKEIPLRGQQVGSDNNVFGLQFSWDQIWQLKICGPFSEKWWIRWHYLI